MKLLATEAECLSLPDLIDKQREISEDAFRDYQTKQLAGDASAAHECWERFAEADDLFASSRALYERVRRTCQPTR